MFDRTCEPFSFYVEWMEMVYRVIIVLKLDSGQRHVSSKQGELRARKQTEPGAASATDRDRLC